MGSKQSQKVLVVDDEESILELLKYNLEKQGYEVKAATNGFDGVEKAKKFQPDLILLDIMMHDQDGVETCRQIREVPELSSVFIIFLTARSEEYSEIAAFDVGADDYITKPIKPRALMSRISALFRRDSKKKTATSQINLGGLLIDRSSYTINMEGQEITLPKKEFELLYFLAQNPNKVFGRDELLQNIWGSDVYVEARTVDVHIGRLRKAFMSQGGDTPIRTVRSAGYSLRTE